MPTNALASSEPPIRLNDHPHLFGLRSSTVLVAKVVVLGMLVLGTSWVITDWISLWLVPFYWFVLALILVPPPRHWLVNFSVAQHFNLRRWDRLRSSPTAPPSISVSGNETSLPVPTENREDGNWTNSDDPVAPRAGSAPRRGRGRPRKVNKPAVDSTVVAEAVWIEVGPGKFVRAEMSGELAVPDDLVVPPEVERSPSTSLEKPLNPAFIEVAASDAESEVVAAVARGVGDTIKQIAAEVPRSFEPELSAPLLSAGRILPTNGWDESGSWASAQSFDVPEVLSDGSDQAGILPESDGHADSVFDLQVKGKLSRRRSRLSSCPGSWEQRVARSRGPVGKRHGHSDRTKDRRRVTGYSRLVRGEASLAPGSLSCRGRTKRR